jgi:ankyrin repeat protein
MNQVKPKLTDKAPSQACTDFKALLGSAGNLQRYIELGEDVNKREAKAPRRALLNIACEIGGCKCCKSEQLVGLLLRAGADANITTDKGLTPLMWSQTVGVARLLLEHGADLNLADESGYTALHLQCSAGRLKMVKMLLKRAPKELLTQPASAGWTPLGLAIDRSREDVALLLLDAQQPEFDPNSEVAKSSLLARAAPKGLCKVVAELLRRGADVNRFSENGSCAHMYASQEGSLPALDLLHKAGADIHAADSRGLTSLMCAAHSGQTLVIKLLARLGVDINVSNGKNGSALCRAALRGHFDAVEALLALGAKLSERTSGSSKRKPLTAGQDSSSSSSSNGVSSSNAGADTGGTASSCSTVTGNGDSSSSSSSNSGNNNNSSSSSNSGISSDSSVTSNGTGASSGDVANGNSSSNSSSSSSDISTGDNGSSGAVASNGNGSSNSSTDSNGSSASSSADSSSIGTTTGNGSSSNSSTDTNGSSTSNIADSGSSTKLITSNGTSGTSSSSSDAIVSSDASKSSSSNSSSATDPQFIADLLQTLDDAAATRMLQLLLPHCTNLDLNTTTVFETVNQDRTLLMRAVVRKHLRAAKALVRAGADPHVATKAGVTALHVAAAVDSVPVIQWLAALGLDCCAFDSFRRSPLYCACQSGAESAVQYLLSIPGVAAATLTAWESGRLLSPLFVAVCHKHCGTAVQLLAAGACVHDRNSVLETALMVAKDVPTVQLLLDNGSDVLAADSRGLTALHHAAKAGVPAAVLCVLLKAGADPTAVDSSGSTPAQLAGVAGHSATEALLSRAAEDYSRRRKEHSAALLLRSGSGSGSGGTQCAATSGSGGGAVVQHAVKKKRKGTAVKRTSTASTAATANGSSVTGDTSTATTDGSVAEGSSSCSSSSANGTSKRSVKTSSGSSKSSSKSSVHKKEKHPCSACGKATSRVCKSCHSVYYCSTDCQTECYKNKEHRQQCEAAAAAALYA